MCNPMLVKFWTLLTALLIIAAALEVVSGGSESEKNDADKEKSRAPFLETQEGFLKIADKLRNDHCAKDLIRDDNLTSVACECAQYYLEKGVIDHSCPAKSKLAKPGENLYSKWSTGPKAGQTPLHDVTASAVAAWYDEIKDYDFEHPGSSKGVTGHFTQLIWKATTRIGCGIVKEFKKKQKSCRFVMVCLYLEAGNVQTEGDDRWIEYKKNVVPATCSSSTTKQPPHTPQKN